MNGLEEWLPPPREWRYRNRLIAIRRSETFGRVRASKPGMRQILVLTALPLFAQDYSVEKERALGAGLMADALRQSKPLGIAAVSEYADFVGSRLSSAIDNRRHDYRFEVVVHPEADEPFGFPGGFVLIPAQFFLEAKNEAEFAGMLAHMVGHIEQRHGARSHRRASAGAKIPLIFMGNWSGAHVGNTRSTLLVPNGFREMARVNELAADKYAVPVLADAGFDAEALRRYLARVHPEEGREERLAGLDAALAGVASRPNGESGFERIRELVRGAVAVRQMKPPSLRR